MRIRKLRRDGIVQSYNVRARNTRDPTEPYVRQKLKMIPVADIEMLEEQWYKNRKKIDLIKYSGPIRVPIRVHGKYASNQKYQVWDGHHRLIAAVERGDKMIPAIIDLNISSQKYWRQRHHENKEA